MGPPAGEIANSAMLGMYETGKIALNLEGYLKANADKLEAQAELGQIVVDEIKAAQPCKLVVAEDGEMECEITLDGKVVPPDGVVGEKVGTTDQVGGGPAAAAADAAPAPSKGAFGLGVLGLKQARSARGSQLAEEESGQPVMVKTRRLTKEEALALGRSIGSIKEVDKSLSARDQSEIKQLEISAKNYNGTGAGPSASIFMTALVAVAVAFLV